MSRKRNIKEAIAGKGDHAAPRPRRSEKKPPAKREDKYAGWEDTFRRDRYGK